MTFQELLSGISGFDDGAGVYVKNASDLSSLAAIYQPDDDELPSDVEGMRFMMEIWQVRETLEGLRSLMFQQNGVAPSATQLFDRFLVYLQRDA